MLAATSLTPKREPPPVPRGTGNLYLDALRRVAGEA